MMNTEIVEHNPAPPDTNTPSRRHWALALISTAFVLGMLYLCEQVSTGYHYASLQAGFAKFLTPDADLMFAVDNPEYASLFVAENRQVKDLRPLISLVTQEDVSKAAAYLKRQAFPKTPLYTQLVRQLNELSALYTSIEASAAELQKVQLTRTDKRYEFALIQIEFRAFLMAEQSPKMPIREEVDDTTVAFYQTGLLANLPVIDGLPDDVADLKSLVQYFPIAKKGASAPSAESVTATLEEFRLRSGLLKNDWLALESQNHELDRATAKNKSQQRELFQASREVIRKLLISLARPELDGASVQSYYLFRETLSKWGYELPELWT